MEKDKKRTEEFPTPFLNIEESKRFFYLEKRLKEGDPSVFKIAKISQLLHNSFEKKWQKQCEAVFGTSGYIYPSFHNFHHLLSVHMAAEKIFKAAEQGNDIFELQNQLSRWNQNHQTEISFERFRELVVAAVYMHDLGNILSNVRIDEEKNFIFKFNEVYLAQEAESKSMQIAGEIMSNFSFPEEEIELVKHLIEETAFNISEESAGQIPFAKFMRVIDQVGGNWFRGGDVDVDVSNKLNAMYVGLMLEDWMEAHFLEKKPRGLTIGEILFFKEQRLKSLVDSELADKVRDVFSAPLTESVVIKEEE